MSDIRKLADDEGRDRKDAMKDLRAAMRQKNDCLEESAHCDNARKAIIDSMRPVMGLDPDYFKTFFREHQAFAASFNDYKYVEELCVVVCAIEAWATPPGAEPAGDAQDPYSVIPLIGGLDLHLHASMYFGFTKQDMLKCFQIVQQMKELEIDALTRADFSFPELDLQDSEDWMLYYTAAVAMKFGSAVRAIDVQRDRFGISDTLRDDIIGAIKSTYWWRYMMMSRAIEPAAMGLPADIRAKADPAFAASQAVSGGGSGGDSPVSH